MCFSLSLDVGTTTLQNMKRCRCTHTHTLTSDAHTFVIYCLFRIPHSASSLRFPACCLPVHAFLLWPVAYSLLPVECGLLHTRPPSAPRPQPPAPSPQPPAATHPTPLHRPPPTHPKKNSDSGSFDERNEPNKKKTPESGYKVMYAKIRPLSRFGFFANLDISVFLHTKAYIQIRVFLRK